MGYKKRQYNQNETNYTTKNKIRSSKNESMHKIKLSCKNYLWI